ncbi:MAG: alpha/beta hydrolase [Limnothrix sp. RL_2_0]|nr:alpha/beta hydrolase [Limnothrix sp. RL_2_0]
MADSIQNKASKPWLKWLLIVLSGVSGIYLVMCLYLLVWQKRIIFNPYRTLEKFPTTYELTSQELFLPVNSKESIHGWWLPSSEPGDRVLLFLHGNSSNIGGNLFHAKRFVELGFSVLLMDYRGFGQSDGAFPHETQVYEDAQVMYKYLTETRKISPDNIVVYGHSLGGAIAIELLSEHPVAGLIAEGTFTSVSDLAAYTGRYSFLPVDLLLHQRFESLSKIKNSAIPTLFIHGTEDQTIPVEMGKTLYAESPAPKQLLIVPGAGHNNVASTAENIYNEAILNFFQFVQQQK